HSTRGKLGQLIRCSPGFPGEGPAMLPLRTWLTKLYSAGNTSSVAKRTRRLEIETFEDRVLPAGTGTGLLGQYYSDPNLTNLVTTELDPTVNFNWNGQSPAAGVPGSTFGARWTGQLQALYTEPTMLYTKSDGGVRVYLDGKLIIDNWADHPYQENGARV